MKVERTHADRDTRTTTPSTECWVGLRPRVDRRGSAYTRLMRAFLALLLALILVAVVADPAWAVSPKDRRFVSARHGLSVEAPPGWTLSTHTGFPTVLVLLLHPDGSRISLAASETPANDARALVESTRGALEQQNMKVLTIRAGARNGVQVEAETIDHAEAIVQLYIVRAPAPDGPRQAVVVSLISTPAALVAHRSELDFVVARLGLNQIAGPTAATAATSKVGSAGERSPEKDRR